MKGELDRWQLFIPLRTETVTNTPSNRKCRKEHTDEGNGAAALLRGRIGHRGARQYGISNGGVPAVRPESRAHTRTVQPFLNLR